MAAAVAAGLGGGLISGLFGMQGGKGQASAEKYAAQLQAQEADKALGFQEKEFATTQANQAPWLSAGKGALTNLQAILKSPGQGWNETFKPPTAAEAAAYPGYQFQEQQGEEALQNSAAAKGALYSGNNEEALARYGEQSAQSDYTNVYNQAFQQYLQRYGQHTDILNRLSALAGTGQTAATTLGQEGQAAAGNVGNIDVTTGAQIGQDTVNAASAMGTGYINMGNSIGGGIANIPYLLALQKLFAGRGGPPPSASAADLQNWGLMSSMPTFSG